MVRSRTTKNGKLVYPAALSWVQALHCVVIFQPCRWNSNHHHREWAQRNAESTSFFMLADDMLTKLHQLRLLVRCKTAPAANIKARLCQSSKLTGGHKNKNHPDFAMKLNCNTPTRNQKNTLKFYFLFHTPLIVSHRHTQSLPKATATYLKTINRFKTQTTQVVYVLTTSSIYGMYSYYSPLERRVRTGWVSRGRWPPCYNTAVICASTGPSVAACRSAAAK